ncbi:NAD(P)/FAD-dependent oxidoreductase [uncultured Thermanaerothrix sp.]|uniref:phytoene desaturase family protein n=1 Tax=uncultured Thermanaerothrix sp. TaxID=1195149 RepID=UPI002615E734|nr:NAD(P)/FAD-dependent oxidoreductase [uncultured Thermanaerothrix sp.]
MKGGVRRSKESRTVLIIGAGMGGLTAAALLLKAGWRVIVLEAQTYPGGCAGTFFHRGYRFDAGATLAGGFDLTGPHTRLAQTLGLTWPVEDVDPAWVVHLDGHQIYQWTTREAWREERVRYFAKEEPFWQTQERVAEVAWAISQRYFPWPPLNLSDLLALAGTVTPAVIGMAPLAFRSVADLLPRSASPRLRTFVDAQLLISAQTTAGFANALYGSAALDLPRRGVRYVRGGMGELAKTLVAWIHAHGGEVHYRHPIEAVVVRRGRAVAVVTKAGATFEADLILANMTPWSLSHLLNGEMPVSLRRDVRRRSPTWGAFTLYVGVRAEALPSTVPTHHQVILDPSAPLGEGNSVFISISPVEDPTRAPAGMRAITLSTHTAVAPWWQLDPEAYLQRREVYTQRLLEALEAVFPGIKTALHLCLPATPRTFAFYTRRWQGMVGGFPQTSLWRARGPQTGIPNLWLVGDSVFPGQSTAGVILGAARVVAHLLGQPILV